jgi:hypothetical protein
MVLQKHSLTIELLAQKYIVKTIKWYAKRRRQRRFHRLSNGNRENVERIEVREDLMNC